VKLIRVRNVRSVAAFISQNCGPLVREVVCVTGTLNKSINQSVTLCGISIRKELLDLSDRWQSTGNINGNSPNKGGIVTER
jgi:hypothetical protein